MDFQNDKQYDTFDDDINFENFDESVDVELDKQHASIFDTDKLELTITLFLDQYPKAQDYEIIDFVTKARRSYVRAKRKNIDDNAWLEKLKKHVITFKFAAPLQRELEKLMLNQELVAMQIEQAKIAKEKAQLEKKKIDFLLEQNNLSKTGKSSIYPNLTTINKLEVLKKDIEKRYQNELRELQSKQKNDMKTVIDSEVERIRGEFDQRYNQWSQFYDMFKQKYFKLQNFSIQMREELNDKNNESYDLKLKINQLINELKNQESQIEMLTSEVEKRAKVIENFRARQPEIIKENVERELEERMIAQTNKINSILLEKEKTLMDEIEERRKQVEQVLEEKQKEYDQMVANTKEAEALLRISNEQLEKVKNDYSKAIQDNELLTNEIQDFKIRNQKLSQLLTKLESDNNDLEKLNKLLVKKYNDSEYFEVVNKKLTSELSQIAKQQEKLISLISQNKISDSKALESFKTITEKIENLDTKVDTLKSIDLNTKNDSYEFSTNNELTFDSNNQTKSLIKEALNNEKDEFDANLSDDIDNEIEPEVFKESIQEVESSNSKRVKNNSNNDNDDVDTQDVLIDKLINIE